MLVVGLGNPGSSYSQTRHNIGFMVINELISRHKTSDLTSKHFNGNLAKTNLFYLLKPTTFMNNSGLSIAKVKSFFKLDMVVVIHDDLDLPFGALRFKIGGGSGGHNGLKSADLHIGKEYVRVRVGIGHPGDRADVSSYVLSAFDDDEKVQLKTIIQHTADAVEALVKSDLESVKSKYSKKRA